MPAVSGSHEHETYYKVSMGYDVWANEATGQKVAISADYQNGGLALTKEDVNALTIGLSLIF